MVHVGVVKVEPNASVLQVNSQAGAMSESEILNRLLLELFVWSLKDELFVLKISKPYPFK